MREKYSKILIEIKLINLRIMTHLPYNLDESLIDKLFENWSMLMFNTIICELKMVTIKMIKNVNHKFFNNLLIFWMRLMCLMIFLVMNANERAWVLARFNFSMVEYSFVVCFFWNIICHGIKALKISSNSSSSSPFFNL